MSIDSISSRGRSEIQSAEKKKLNTNHEKEINKIKSHHQAEKDQILLENKLKLIAEKERQAETLARLGKEIDRTENNLIQKKDFLIDKNLKEISTHQLTQAEKLKINDEHFNNKLEHQKSRHKDGIHKMNLAFVDEQNSKLLNRKDTLASIEEKNKNDLKERASQIQARSMYENKIGEEAVRKLKIEKNRQFQNEDGVWKHKIQQQNVTNQIELARQEKLWKETINNEIQNHGQLYSKTLEQQKAEFKNQEQLFLKENERIKSEASTQLQHVMKKTSDPFYQNSSIKPSVEDKGDSYQISIKVPDHEKDRYLLSGHERTLTLSFSREFQHDNKEENNVSKTRRVESYNQSFFVPEIVKANSVSKNYDNGKLTFNIKKA